MEGSLLEGSLLGEAQCRVWEQVYSLEEDTIQEEGTNREEGTSLVEDMSQEEDKLQEVGRMQEVCTDLEEEGKHLVVVGTTLEEVGKLLEEEDKSLEGKNLEGEGMEVSAFVYYNKFSLIKASESSVKLPSLAIQLPPKSSLLPISYCYLKESSELIVINRDCKRVLKCKKA